MNAVETPPTHFLETEVCRRRLQVERRARRKAEKDSRLKDDFLALISHELRTPLTAIMGWVEILRTSEDAPPTFQSGLELIEQCAKRQQRLIEDLLDFSRARKGSLSLDFDLLDPALIASELCEALRAETAAKELVLRFAAAPTCLPWLQIEVDYRKC